MGYKATNGCIVMKPLQSSASDGQQHWADSLLVGPKPVLNFIICSIFKCLPIYNIVNAAHAAGCMLLRSTILTWF